MIEGNFDQYGRSNVNALGRTGGATRWTVSAFECYQRSCICSNCYLKDILSNCQMKASVLELVKKFGLPKGVSGYTIIKTEDEKEKMKCQKIKHRRCKIKKTL